MTEIPTVELLDDLTTSELALIQAARRGDALRCSALDLDVLASTLDPQHTVRAALIRELLLGRWGHLDPRGVQLYGARVSGTINLELVRTEVCLTLIECVLDEPVELAGAKLSHLDFTGSRFPGLYADGLYVDGNLFLDNVSVRRAEDLSALHMPAARVTGQLRLVGVNLHNESGPAVLADRLEVGGSLIFTEAQITGAGVGGAVRVVNGKIGGQCTMNGTCVRNDSGPALFADGIQTLDNLSFDRFEATSHSEDSAITLRGARVDGQLSANDLRVSNDIGCALNSDRLQVSASASFRRLRAVGCGDGSVIRLLNAKISGQLTMNNADVHNTSGPAVAADGLRVDGDLYMWDGQIVGAGEGGAIRLTRAHVEQLTLNRTEVRNASGPAVVGDVLRVDANLVLDDARITGTGAASSVRLPNARVDGQLTAERTRLHNQSGLCLDLQGAKFGAGVVLSRQVFCPLSEDNGKCDKIPRVGLDDIEFNSIAPTIWNDWIHGIQYHTPTYTPAPYQQLASVERRAGHDGNARRILITQQRDLGRRAPEALGGRLTRCFQWLWGILTGYGYRVRRTALALLLAIIAAGAMGWWSGQVETRPGHHAAERTLTSGAQGTRCSTVELIGLGLDRGLPLGPTGLRTRCDLDTSTTAGQGFTTAIWLVQAAVWGLATLALAGYTGLIRKAS